MKNKFTNIGIIKWLVFQSGGVMIASMLAFLFVVIAANNFWGTGMTSTDWGIIGGTVLPLCVFLGVLNYFWGRYMASRVEKLVKGINKVADGNFDVRLEPGNSGPLLQVYQNFNKMCDELCDVQILRNDFLNNYSHEFKTPISSINGFANWLLDNEVSEEDRRRYLKIIADESARLAELANSTLLLSRLGSQQIIPDRGWYDLSEQLRQCAIMFSSGWSEKNINVVGEIEDVLFYGNADIMQHLWLNLINNAVKYTPEHGEIILKLTEKQQQAVVTITDTGCGMSEEVAARIFDPYYQANTAQAKHGLGLGLSIVKRIIDLCAGSIEVQSILDEGSTFTVILPDAKKPHKN